MTLALLHPPFLLAAEEEPAFTWWGLINPAWNHIPHYLIMGWVVAAVLTILSILVKVSLSHGDPVIPKDPSEMGVIDWIRNVYESIVTAMVDLVDGLMPHHHEGRSYLWLVAPVFLYILVGNLMALVPGFQPATNSVNTNLAVALTVFILYNAYGLKSSGLGYLRHFWAPKGVPLWIVWFVGPLLLVIEFFSHVFRPITLTLRLFGNMTGDHTAFSTFLGMVPIGVPILFLLMGLLVALIQAYVFTLLTAIYVALATSHDH